MLTLRALLGPQLNELLLSIPQPRLNCSSDLAFPVAVMFVMIF